MAKIKMVKVLRFSSSFIISKQSDLVSGGSEGKEPACNAGDLGSIPGLGRSHGGRHVNPLQDSRLENPHG